MVRKVISGGQTGADQAGLFAAEAFGIETGGWMPKGFLTLAGNSCKMKVNSCIVDRFRIEGQNMWEQSLTDANVIEEIQKHVLDSLEDRKHLSLKNREYISKLRTTSALSNAKEMPATNNSEYTDTREDLIRWCKRFLEKCASMWRTWLTNANEYEEISNLIRQQVQNQFAERNDLLERCSIFTLLHANFPPVDDPEYQDTKEDLIQWCKRFAENRANTWENWENWLTNGYEEILKLVYRHVSYKFGDRNGVAEDCAAYALVQAWKNPPIDSLKFSDSKAELIRWCKNVATNKAIDEARRTRADYYEEGFDPPDDNDQPNPTEIVALQQLIQDSIDYIEREFPGNQYKLVLDWSMIEGLTDSQIAERLGWGNDQAATRRANRTQNDAMRLIRASLFDFRVDDRTAEIIAQGIDHADKSCDGCLCSRVLSLYYYTMSDKRTVFDELFTPAERKEGYHKYCEKFKNCQTLFWQYLVQHNIPPKYWR
jgi:RNA polymerase sigma factor (sigma-70 family)